MAQNRHWFYHKKEKRMGDIFGISLLFLLFAYFMLPEYFWPSVVAIASLFVYLTFKEKKAFKIRAAGLSTEDDYVAWLKSVSAERGVEVVSSITMKYGDIDAYIPSMGVVIDVKAFGRVDNRVKDPKILESIKRQKSHANAHTAIVWLPKAKYQSQQYELADGVFVVTGKRGLIQAIYGGEK